MLGWSLQVSVSRKGVEAVRLKEGSFFGEHALLEDDRCLKTGVTAVGDVECYVLNRDDFNKHLGSLQDVLRMRTAALGRARRESQFARVEAEKRIKVVLNTGIEFRYSRKPVVLVEG